MQYGSIPHRAVLRSFELAGRSVAPAFAQPAEAPAE
jgi:hypothetical protein